VGGDNVGLNRRQLKESSVYPAKELRKDGKNGQVIPESNSPDYQGTWSGGTDQPALANHMGTLGATIVMSGTGSGYGPMTCTWIGTTLTCKLQKIVT
jgi:hypothetical protein